MTQSKGKIYTSWENEPSKFVSVVGFLNWFDGTTSVEETIRVAKYDWESRLIKFPDFLALNKISCLEIGFGGGRLITQACKTFKNVIGIDIHNSFNKTQEFLENQGLDNFKLLHRDEISNLADNSIDFIYSFIVFQHFESFEEIDFYITHIKRLLSENGCAHIFFGKNYNKDICTTDSEQFEKRQCSLFIKPEYFRQYLLMAGFEIIESEDILKKRMDLPDGPNNISGQARVLFRNKTCK